MWSKYDKYRDINYKKPKLQTIYAFLESKNWFLKKEDALFRYYAPPKTLGILDEDFLYRIPANEKGEDYENWTFGLLIGFHQLYDLDLQLLFDLLSKDSKEFKKGFEKVEKATNLQRQMLAKMS